MKEAMYERKSEGGGACGARESNEEMGRELRVLLSDVGYMTQLRGRELGRRGR